MFCQNIEKMFCQNRTFPRTLLQVFKRCHLSSSSFPFCILIIIVSKVLKDFPLFHGNSDMLDNLMDFSPRDKNKLIFRGKEQPSFFVCCCWLMLRRCKIYKWVTYRVPSKVKGPYINYVYNQFGGGHVNAQAFTSFSANFDRTFTP